MDDLKPHHKDRNMFMQEVISNLIERRKELRYTQADIDYMMGNSDGQCSKWECGMRSPTAFNLYCWSESLNLVLALKKQD